MEIAAVEAGSAAERAGLGPGDDLARINGHAVRDCVDFYYLASDEHLTLEVTSSSGEERTLEIHRVPGEDLGLTALPDRIRRCSNHCVFCFVDQLPRGLRPSLYVKDEDYRYSFLHGSYVTLTNLTRADFDRIGAQRLSPLYVSVHATDPELRGRLLGNARAGDVMTPLGRLAEMRISVHAQIVLVPGWNDGDHLHRTVHDLLSLHPHLATVAIVPVGLTRHRDGQCQLASCTPGDATRLIDEVGSWQRVFMDSIATRGVFLADEFYLLAGQSFPPVREYETLAQIENGVGMTPVFLSEVRSALQALSSSELAPVSATLVTGVLMGPLLDEVLAQPIRDAGGHLSVINVRNRFLGHSVTVSGLLAGADIAHALGPRLGGKDHRGPVFLPPNCVNEDGLLLDNLAPEDLGSRLDLDIRVAPAAPRAFLAELIEGSLDYA